MRNAFTGRIVYLTTGPSRRAGTLCFYKYKIARAAFEKIELYHKNVRKQHVLVSYIVVQSICLHSGFVNTSQEG